MTKILHVCKSYDTYVNQMVELCDAQLDSHNVVLLIHEDYIDVTVCPDGLKCSYYNRDVESLVKPDIIITYADTEEAFLIDPKCPIFKLGERYACCLWPLPTIRAFKRQFHLRPSACKINTSSISGFNNPKNHGDVYDVWVFDSFDAAAVSYAMAWGCVPVVPATTGASSWIAHGITGVIYHNYAEMMMYTDELKNDPLLRSEIAAAASQWVREHADFKILDDLISRIENRDGDNS